jgi:hypothetical protein
MATYHDKRNACRPCVFALPDAEEHVWSMPCLEEQAFREPVETQRAINIFAPPHGYAIVYKGTSYDKRHTKRLIRYGCDRQGVSRGQREPMGSSSRPNARSRKCGCPMEVYFVRQVDEYGNTDWGLQHRGRALSHNYPPSSHPASHMASHPILRRAARTHEVRQLIAVDGETGTTARQTIARLLVENPELLVIPRDVHNERARAANAVLGGLSRIECLLQTLQ